MILTVNVETNDDAAATDPRGEAVRMLKEIARKLEGGREDGAVHDENGNRAGSWEFDPQCDE